MEDILLCLIACTNTRTVRGTNNVWDRGQDFPLTAIVLLLFLPVDQDTQFGVNPEWGVRLRAGRPGRYWGP